MPQNACLNAFRSTPITSELSLLEPHIRGFKFQGCSLIGCPFSWIQLTGKGFPVENTWKHDHNWKQL
ncbi:hypothetical protein HOLleu_19671 [Holothuria leucospilota]|uniref:Uncharacterized protein n=1 Tax=Holothuria leucospilota TaxID=206669 RepID=A0A9Q1BZX2_HOLLE|nr:hypothetical protein HOLleu_19671 [Holothuria leucospilota]